MLRQGLRSGLRGLPAAARGAGPLSCARTAPARGLCTLPTLPPRTAERTAELERLAEERNGFLFGESPLADGERRQWEEWEYIYYPFMTSAFVLYGPLRCRPRRPPPAPAPQPA